jgi:hypothetical protein
MAPNDLGLPAIVVVISEHCKHGRVHAVQIVRQNFRLARLAVVGQITAQHGHVGELRHLRKQVTVWAVVRLANVKVPDRSDTQRPVSGPGHAAPPAPCQ